MVKYSTAISIMSIVASSMNAIASAHEVRKGMDMRKYADELKHLRVNATKSKSPSKSSKAGKSSKGGKGGALYTMTNVAENKILIYSRNGNDGTLTFEGSELTTGLGGDEPGISADSLTVAGECLLAVNGFSHDISTFQIHSVSEISLAGKVASGGTYPVSIAEKDGLVYALNTGGNGSIQAYSLTQNDCLLSPIGGPIELRATVVPPLDPPNSNTIAGDIRFTPQGQLLVTIKINGGLASFASGSSEGSLNFYDIDPEDGSTSDGALTQTLVSLNGGTTIPFSFDFDDDGRVLVAEAISGGPTSSGAVGIFEDGELVERVENGQNAVCWIAYSSESSCIYTSNTNLDASLSSFSLKNGSLELVASRVVDIDLPGDLALSNDEEYLYVLSFGNLAGSLSHIVVYKPSDDCALEEVQRISDGFDQMNTGTTGPEANREVGLALYEP